MFDLSINEVRRVIICRFDEEMTVDDFAMLDEIGRTRREVALYDCIFDLTHVQRADLPQGFATERAEIPQAFRDRERLYVVNKPELRELIQRYADGQAARGWKTPRIVSTRDEAFALLGVSSGDFRGF